MMGRLAPANGKGGRSAKTNVIDCLGSDLSTHLSNVKQAGRGGVERSWSLLRRKREGLARGLVQILKN